MHDPAEVGVNVVFGAKGLEKANFSDTKSLAKNLIRIIEQYGLNDLDS